MGPIGRVAELQRHFQHALAAAKAPQPVPVRPPGMPPMMPAPRDHSMLPGVIVEEPPPPPPPEAPPPGIPEVPGPPELSPEPDPWHGNDVVLTWEHELLKSPTGSYSYCPESRRWRTHPTPELGGGWSDRPPVPPDPSAVPPFGIEAWLEGRRRAHTAEALSTLSSRKRAIMLTTAPTSRDPLTMVGLQMTISVVSWRHGTRAPPASLRKAAGGMLPPRRLGPSALLRGALRLGRPLPEAARAFFQVGCSARKGRLQSAPMSRPRRRAHTQASGLPWWASATWRPSTSLGR